MGHEVEETLDEVVLISDAAYPQVETSVPAPAVTTEIVRGQLLAAAMRTVSQSLRLVSQASGVVARMAVSREHSTQLIAPPKPKPFISVQLRLLNGQIITQMMASDRGLRSMQESVAEQTKVPPVRQSLVLVEERNRSPTLQTFTRYLARQLHHGRQDTRGFVMGWANFLIFPEAFAREFSGQGCLGWARAALKLRLLELQREKSGKAVLSVEPIGCQVISVGADPLQPLSDVQLMIEQQTQIMVEQQSLLILEKPVPGMGSHLLDQVLLLWLELFKVLTLSVAVTKSLWLQYHPWSKVIHMPLNVATADGCNISMLVTEDTTVGEIRKGLARTRASSLPPAAPGPLSTLSFPISRTPYLFSSDGPDEEKGQVAE
ncbi:hypothetical protein WJX84_005174 [Apatococcus fuscideae]|uniref:Uncharacterized protein n=1 Tax=Apatococcus fuscideae TaxID=2026836 RepID=A0AAW1TEF3_9CHLO